MKVRGQQELAFKARYLDFSIAKPFLPVRFYVEGVKAVPLYQVFFLTRKFFLLLSEQPLKSLPQEEKLHHPNMVMECWFILFHFFSDIWDYLHGVLFTGHRPSVSKKCF